MGFFSNLFTLPGTSAANKANTNLANSAQQQTDWNKQWQNAVSPYLQSISPALNNAGTALNQPLTQIKLQQYNSPSGGYNMPNTPGNAYGGVTTPTNAFAGLDTASFNINNLPDTYKMTPETAKAMIGNIDPGAYGQSVKNSYAMNANQALADRGGAINTEAMRRGLGGRQGGMSSLETSAISGLANQGQKMAAEGNLAGINAETNTQQILGNLIGARENLSRNASLDAMNKAQYQNTLTQQDYDNKYGLANANQNYGQNNFSNQMGLANANQSWGQQDYTNKMNSIGQLRDWTMGDINQNNNTAIQEGTYNTNQQQTGANNQMQWLQMLMSMLSPSTMSGNASDANNTWAQVGQNANNQMANSAGSLKQFASLFPNALKF
jgi:hypothetical protein